MGFVWRSSGVGTITEHEQTEELVHNIDHVWHLLSEPVSAKIWSEMPASAGGYLEVIVILIMFHILCHSLQVTKKQMIQVNYLEI